MRPVGAHLVVPLVLGSSVAVGAERADLPRFDVERACTSLVGTNDPKAPMRNLCIQREQTAYAAAGALWASSDPADRTKCTEVAERSHSYKYVYLQACLRSTGRAKALSTPQKFQY